MKKLKKLFESRSKNFWLFLSYSFIHNLGKSVSSIFIPIILLQLGFSLFEVIFYYVLFYGFNIFFNFLSKSFIVKFGVRKSFIVSTTSLVIFFILYLSLVAGNWYILTVMAILMAIYDSFHYIARNYSIMDSSLKKENIKANNVIITIVGKMSSFLGPLIGALIILFTENENIILSVTIFILLLSFIPLLKYKRNDNIKDGKINFKKDLLENKGRREDYLNLSLFRFSETAEGILWPVFIYLVFQSLDSVAFLSILVVFISLFFTYMTVKIDQKHKSKYILWGAIGLIGIWVLRYFFDNNILLYATSVLTGVFALLIRTPIDTSILIRGKEYVPIMSAFYKNQISMIIGFIFYSILFIILYYLELKDSFLVIVASLMVLAIVNYFIIKKK